MKEIELDFTDIYPNTEDNSYFIYSTALYSICDFIARRRYFVSIGLTPFGNFLMDNELREY